MWKFQIKLSPYLLIPFYLSQIHFSDDISANWKRICALPHIFVYFFDNQPNEHLQVWTMLVKTVGIIAIMVNVIGVAMLESVVGKDGLKMDVMAPLVGQINMNVYWIQVEIFFLILEQKIYKNKMLMVPVCTPKSFVLALKLNFLNANPLLIWDKKFGTGAICKSVFGMAQKIWTSPKCRTRHRIDLMQD